MPESSQKVDEKVELGYPIFSNFLEEHSGVRLPSLLRNPDSGRKLSSVEERESEEMVGLSPR